MGTNNIEGDIESGREGGREGGIVGEGYIKIKRDMGDIERESDTEKGQVDIYIYYFINFIFKICFI